MTEKKDNIFSGLESLGFNNLDSVDLYNKAKKEKKEKVYKKDEKPIEAFLYDKTMECPVCSRSFKARAVKKEGARVQKQDSDFYVHYYPVNKYFYDVAICPHCGYSSLQSDFLKIRDFQIKNIISSITPKWKNKDYPYIYDVDIAIERYKLALLSSVVIEGKASQKANICLRISWMYRLKGLSEEENIFLNKALEGFLDCYYNESNYPIYNLDKFSLSYLIAELYRRLGKDEEAMLWFSNLIVSPEVKTSLKEKARTQKDIMKGIQ